MELIIEAIVWILAAVGGIFLALTLDKKVSRWLRRSISSRRN